MPDPFSFSLCASCCGSDVSPQLLLQRHTCLPYEKMTQLTMVVLPDIIANDCKSSIKEAVAGELQTSLGYIQNSRPAWARDFDPASRKKNVVVVLSGQALLMKSHPLQRQILHEISQDP